MATIWDTSFNTTFVYTNGNRTANNNSISANWETARSNTSHASNGLYYFEASLDSTHNTGVNQYDSWGIGVCNGSGPLHAFMGQTSANGIMCSTGNAAQDVWYNSVKTIGLGGACYRPGDRCAVAINLTTPRIWFRNITRDVRDATGVHWWGQNGTGADDPTSSGTGFPIDVLVGVGAVFIGFSGTFSASTDSQVTLYPSVASGFLGVVPSAAYQAWDLSVVLGQSAVSVI